MLGMRMKVHVKMRVCVCLWHKHFLGIINPLSFSLSLSPSLSRLCLSSLRAADALYAPRTRPMTRHLDPLANIRPSYTLRYESGMIETHANPINMQRFNKKQQAAMQVRGCVCVCGVRVVCVCVPSSIGGS